MSRLLSISLFIFICLASVKSARILGVYPIPSISHQVVFRALNLELLKNGHEVVVITPNPVYKNEECPKNLTEIDISDGYKLLLSLNTENRPKTKRGVIMDADMIMSMNKHMVEIIYYIFKDKEVSKLIADKSQKFDLIIIESLSYPALMFGTIYNAPVVLFSSMYGTTTNYETVGAVSRHPLLYPHMFRDNYKKGLINKIKQIYLEYKFWRFDQENEQLDNDFLKYRFGPDVPTVAELKKNVALLLVNSHPIFDGNRPVPPGTVYLGATHLQPTKELPQDLKSYLDNSSRGVVYVSLGTNVRPSLMDKDFLDAFLEAFEKIPFDILWKFDGDNLEKIPKNVRVQKWFPQRDLLDHPNIKLFVMQGGLQSTDEAIDSEVPLVGIPFLADQFYNINKYVELGIGVAVDSFTMVADDLVKAVNTVANDPSYKENMKKLRSIMHDQRESPLERAVWWTEHVLRHKNSRHLLGPAAQLSWPEYLMLDVLIPLAIGFTLLVALSVFAIIYIVRLILGIKSDIKIKQN